MPDNRLHYLFERFYEQQASTAEQTELAALIAAGEQDDLLNRAVDELLEHAIVAEKMEPQAAQAILQSIIAAKADLVRVPVRHIHFLKRAWFRYAAILLLIAGAGGVVWVVNHRSPGITKENRTKSAAMTNVLPGGNKAILTLADGSRIVLDRAADGTLAQQGTTKILKLDAGKLAYKAGSATGELLYNTISTPNGGQYQIVLSDGTKVWLNAASGIRFPAIFGKTRRVEVMGEAYLEVAADKSKPFYITANGATIQVLGTSLNINAYANEPAVKTTLLTGRIQVIQGAQSQLLMPGQQAVINQAQEKTSSSSERITTNVHVDLGQVMAWKNGRFQFEGTTLAEVMRQVGRWYNVDIQYTGNIQDQHFIGGISRSVELTQVFKLLQAAGNLHFRIDGRTVVVSP